MTRRQLITAVALLAISGRVAARAQERKERKERKEPKLETVTLVISGMT